MDDAFVVDVDSTYDIRGQGAPIHKNDVDTMMA
jgi:hypothetical protein